jgi:hypothetical protein
MSLLKVIWIGEQDQSFSKFNLAKAHAAFGKFSPDIEDVKAVRILRHRIIKNYKADAEGLLKK